MYVFCKNNYLKHLLLLHLDKTMIIMFVAISSTSIYTIFQVLMLNVVGFEFTITFHDEKYLWRPNKSLVPTTYIVYTK